MSRTLYDRWNLDLVDTLEDFIRVVLTAPHGFGRYRHELEAHRDALRDLAEAFGYCDDDDSESEAYLCLFDAVAYLTEATRGRGINVGKLRSCLKSLQDFRGKAVLS